jgi:hypothetical protein
VQPIRPELASAPRSWIESKPARKSVFNAMPQRYARLRIEDATAALSKLPTFGEDDAQPQAMRATGTHGRIDNDPTDCARNAPATAHPTGVRNGAFSVRDGATNPPQHAKRQGTENLRFTAAKRVETRRNACGIRQYPKGT